MVSEKAPAKKVAAPKKAVAKKAPVKKAVTLKKKVVKKATPINIAQMLGAVAIKAPAKKAAPKKTEAPKTQKKKIIKKVLTDQELQNNVSTAKEIISIKSRNFEDNKKKLERFSKKMPPKMNIASFNENGRILRFTSHKVEGEEMNERLEVIQDCFKTQRSAIISTIKEFNVIYDTFAALDKEYIQGIIISLGTAKKASENALDGLEKVEVAQKNITELIDKQVKIIEVLQSFKLKAEKQLSDTSTISNDILKLKEELDNQKKEIELIKGLRSEEQ